MLQETNYKISTFALPTLITVITCQIKSEKSPNLDFKSNYCNKGDIII